jgi:hypothetical protein
MGYNVAISYVSEDFERAEEIYAALEARDLRVYWDQGRDARLQTWGKDLKKHLAKIFREAECSVVLLSPSYFLSEWTELELAKSKNALPVVIESTRIPANQLAGIAYSQWPDGGVDEFVEEVLLKMEFLRQDGIETRRTRRSRLLKGVAAIGATAAGIAVTAAANQRTQAKIEENTGPIDGMWTDVQGVAWRIEEDGTEISLVGRTPNAVDVLAVGSRNGRNIRAVWESPHGTGALAGAIGRGGKRIVGQMSGALGVGPWILTR